MAEMNPEMDPYARARFRIAMDEIDRRVRAAQNPHTAWLYATQREQEERDARRSAAIAKMHDFYTAKRRARQAAKLEAEKKAATSGPGWKVLDTPYLELEAKAQRLWRDAFCAIPWPKDWKVRWGNLAGRGALGICAYQQKLIVVDKAAHQQCPVPSEQLTETLAHEIAHSQHPGDSHGPAFAETLRRLLAVVLPKVPVAPKAVAARPPHPEPGRGQWLNGRPLTTPDGWEIRG
jgi:hypothetical protein